MSEITDDDRKKHLGKYIKKWRKNRGMTLQEAADASGTSKSYFHEIESGKSEMSFKIASRIAKAIIVPIFMMSIFYTNDYDEGVDQ